MRRLRRAKERQARKSRKLKRRFVAAGAAAAITLGAGVTLHKALGAPGPDPHQLPVAADGDADLLAHAEEAALAYLDFERDQNRNGTPDGVELAKLCAADINDLPWQGEAAPGQAYKWFAPQYGLETCDVCGETIGMGPGGVVNPHKAISVEFPFGLTLHYMQHGSFSYTGHYSQTPVEGRVDVPALLQALDLRLSCQPNDHQLPVAQDADADLLANKEELAIGYKPFDPDQNRNEIPDGIELAKRCATVVAELPSYSLWPTPPETNEIYKVEHALDGLERCYVCGQDIHMGGWEIINPKLGLKYPDPKDPLDRMFLPDLALHYMEHGSFDCYGHDHKGRVNIPRLLSVLEMRFPYDPNDHQLPVPQDADSDLLANKEELAIGYCPFNPDQNRNEIPDGIELAKRCADAVEQLPLYKQAEPNEIYKLESPAEDGMENCHVCGEMIYMGGWYIINPRLHLQYPEPNDPNNWEFLPELALHYMQHGSFDYLGTVHTGRAEINRLLRVLEMRFPYEPNDHQLPLDYVVKGVGQLAPDANDLDGDRLADSEELAAGYNLHDPDQDDDLLPDGIELAKQCAAIIDELPVYSGHPPPAGTYKVEYDQRGLEYCPICGESVNMGGWGVVNPKLGVSIYIDRITIHYMRHGSFSYHGLWQPGGEPQHAGRIDLALLVKILEMPRHCGDLGTLYLPGDHNKDCKQDFRDFAKFADKWLESTDTNQD